MNPLIPVDTSWFDKNQERYLQREEFQEFQSVANVNFRDLLSRDPNVVQAAQENIVSQSKVFNEIRNEHSGYSMPFLAYTHDFQFAEPIAAHNQDLDKLILGYDIIDSLRRRHMALSHAILPREIMRLSELSEKNCVFIKNLGSGVGLDVINALCQTDSCVSSVQNYDINPVAVGLGWKIVRHLEEVGRLQRDVVKYYRESFLASRECSDMIVLIGVICGMTDRAASVLLRAVYRNLRGGGGGGVAIVSSSNINMVQKDPIGAFIVQHLGSPHDLFSSWGLNFRTRETMEALLLKAGFSEVSIYDDANYPGREALPDTILHGIDPLPSRVANGAKQPVPLALPRSEILSRRIGYNWIAVARKK